MRVTVDTNIVVDMLSQHPKAKKIFEENDVILSQIVWIEVLSGARNKEQFDSLKQIFDNFEIISMTDKIAERAAKLRMEKRLKLPDAIIYATAQEEGVTLLTRDIKDFSDKWIDVKIPYGV